MISRAVSASREQEPALIFGLGMNNNGEPGWVLASASLAGNVTNGCTRKRLGKSSVASCSDVNRQLRIPRK